MKALVRISTGKTIQCRAQGHSANRQTPVRIFLNFSQLGGREEAVRGARKGGVRFFIEKPRRGGFSQEGGAGNLVGGGW